MDVTKKEKVTHCSWASSEVQAVVCSAWTSPGFPESDSVHKPLREGSWGREPRAQNLSGREAPFSQETQASPAARALAQ